MRAKKVSTFVKFLIFSLASSAHSWYSLIHVDMCVLFRQFPTQQHCAYANCRNIEIRESDSAATHSCNDYYDDCCDCDCIHLIRHWHELSHSSQPHLAPSWWWQSELDLFAEALMALDNPSMSDNIFCLFENDEKRFQSDNKQPTYIHDKDGVVWIMCDLCMLSSEWRCESDVSMLMSKHFDKLRGH